MKKPVSILEDIKRIVMRKHPHAKIYLYGSRARGTATNESDWDFLILLNREKITNEIEEELISPMVYLEEEWNSKYRITPFYHNVMKEGQLL
ncbi:MAG: nucleotidyltransferase domain-containing protein [Chlorobi bacterium]|nr:nucleotidyltransferase domain-containing protein [Chlorobiota bacterium]